MASTGHKKINVMFIIDFFHGEGGTEKHLYQLVKHINKDRYNCFICSFNSVETTGLIRETKEEVKGFYHIPIGRYYTLHALRQALKLSRIIKSNEIDIVQTYHFESDTLGVIVSKLSGVSYVVSSRRDTGDKKKRIHVFLNRCADRFIDKFITVCDAVGKKLREAERVPAEKCVTIYNGVDMRKYGISGQDDVREARKELKMGEEDFVIGMIAHLRPEKSYDIFLKAIKEVRDRIRNLRVIAIGSGPEMEECLRYCRENGLEGVVSFKGQIKDVRKYIAVMDVACLVPESNEGFSNALLEEMAMGKAVIATAVGGNEEAIVNGENGIIIPPRDYMKLADSLCYLYENPAIRREMGRKGRERVERYFSLGNMIRNHENLYEGILGGRSADRIEAELSDDFKKSAGRVPAGDRQMDVQPTRR
jgi:glycosyltransferase involved in cell wall biosynthesis